MLTKLITKTLLPIAAVIGLTLSLTGCEPPGTYPFTTPNYATGSMKKLCTGDPGPYTNEVTVKINSDETVPLNTLVSWDDGAAYAGWSNMYAGQSITFIGPEDGDYVKFEVAIQPAGGGVTDTKVMNFDPCP